MSSVNAVCGSIRADAATKLVGRGIYPSEPARVRPTSDHPASAVRTVEGEATRWPAMAVTINAIALIVDLVVHIEGAAVHVSAVG
jgi:hypothetical protein